MIDLLIYILETHGDDVEEAVIVAVGASQLGVAPYRHEPAKKHRQSKLDETDTCGESDAVTGSTAAHRDRPPSRLDNTEWFIISINTSYYRMLNSFTKQVSKFVRIAVT